jgi:hypothetical protein
MKKLLQLLFFIPLIFSCDDENGTDFIEINLLETLKSKVYHKDIPDGERYVYFDLSYLGEDFIGEQYEGWSYYEKHNNNPDEAGCLLDYNLYSSDYSLYLNWHTDTIIDSPIQFKLDGVYGQTWIVTKDDNDMISIESNGVEFDDGYIEMNLEVFLSLGCM